MKWNLHRYYSNKSSGLYGMLKLSDEDEMQLKALRKIIRTRIRDVFDDARQIAKVVRKQLNSPSDVALKLRSSRLSHLLEQEREKVAQLIFDLDEEGRQEFIAIAPRFGTQGSFQYKTLNKPYFSGQEMDIDDGTYLPMPIFEKKPKPAHELLVLLVSSALKSLAAEKPGWSYAPKQTCGRIKIPARKTHIDVPMYAIPKVGFATKEVALTRSISLESAHQDNDNEHRLDKKNVNLALRDGGWINSDPKVVEDWFEEACARNGNDLRKYCRFMKAWRDAQWQVGGPTSISLMAAIVDILDEYGTDSTDMCSTMLHIASELPEKFKQGIESPDESDERPLFPKGDENSQADIIARLEELAPKIQDALNAETKDKALNAINEVFGDRVKDSSLIDPKSAAPAYKEEPELADNNTQIKSSLSSG